MTRSRLPRRRFAQSLLASIAGAPILASATARATDASGEVVIPPVDAEELTSACAFCIVGCGYRAFRWPVGSAMGGPAASDNALRRDLSTPAPLQPWIAPTNYNVVEVDGVPHHLVVLPDYDARVVNPGGDYTLGGSLARRLYSPEDPRKQDRFLRPQLRVDGALVDIPWGAAIEIVAAVSNAIVDTHGPTAWGLKTYSYQFYENTYAITKLAFGKVGTPCWAPHDQPRTGSSTPGLSVAGINAFSASYEDWRQADVLYVSGVSLYDARGVLFSNWASATSSDGLVDDAGTPVKALVVVNPRRDVTAQWAQDNGGIHLQLAPGTDTVLNNAIARLLVERGWHDQAFLERYVVDAQELEGEQADHALRASYGATPAEYIEMLLSEDTYQLETAAQITGVPAQDIERAASLIGEPRRDANGELRTPRSSFMLEKGNYWSHNFPNSASLAALGLLAGAGNRPGQVISRGGGHQRGMMRAAPYPMELSPETLEDRPAGINLDKWVMDGKLRMAWAIGCTWAGGGAAAAAPLFARIAQLVNVQGPLTRATAFPNGEEGEPDVQAIVAQLVARANAGGMVLVQQDLYPQSLTELADLVLPASSWGEDAFTRMQGERRLRHYAQLCDAPGECKSDWQIVAEVAKAMGYDGFDWADSAAIFDEAAEVSSGSQAYAGLVELAQQQGMRGHDLLATYGTDGVQCPVRLEDGELAETTRLHDADVAAQTDGERGDFSTASGKAVMPLGRWSDVQPRQELLQPAQDELWILNRRDSRTWSAMIEDRRIEHRFAQMPENVLEVAQEDARRLGLEDGQRVRVEGPDVVDPTIVGVPQRVATFEATVESTDRLQPGVACAYFNYLGDVTQAANNTVSNTTDPINGMYSFKLGRGRIVPL